MKRPNPNTHVSSNHTHHWPAQAREAAGSLSCEQILRCIPLHNPRTWCLNYFLGYKVIAKIAQLYRGHSSHPYDLENAEPLSTEIGRFGSLAKSILSVTKVRLLVPHPFDFILQLSDFEFHRAQVIFLCEGVVVYVRQALIDINMKPEILPERLTRNTEAETMFTMCQSCEGESTLLLCSAFENPSFLRENFKIESNMLLLRLRIVWQLCLIW
mmetsp:Transcript_37574/g.78672  ORF Transcript_37574/g.78672 Transcript_37574/m.78672 type:complete len:213 (-) Transcript_37574:155-793(-)